MKKNLWHAKFIKSLGVEVLLWALAGSVMYACNTTPDTFGKLDLKSWRNDRNGCNGTRLTQLAAFKAEAQQLKGKRSDEIGTLFGRPDVNQLADRNQKFYIYYLETGPQCASRGAKSDSRSVALRMSAIGLVTEITYQNGLP
jgi:hypothetical protein